MNYNTSTRLTSKVTLKKNEKHCGYCQGYGGNPIDRMNTIIFKCSEKCYYCNGTGKEN
jgi:DnaJ-class molecular chaperone